MSAAAALPATGPVPRGVAITPVACNGTRVCAAPLSTVRHRRARPLRRQAWALGRRGVVVFATLLVVLGVELVCAPAAAAFDIFGPVKRAFTDALNGFIDAIAKAVCGFVAGMVHGILGYADKGLGIDFSASWFKDNYQHMMLGGFLMGLAIMLVQCTAAALRRNPYQMLTSVAATGIGVLASFVSLSLIMMVSGAIDDWCAMITGGSSIADGTRDTITSLPDKIGGVGAIFVAVLYLVFALALFIILIVRRLGIFVIALFIPVYAGGLGGGWTNGMVKRASELLFVLLMSKLAIIATFALGESMLVGDTKGLDVEVSVISGVVVMAFAVLSPLAVMYLVAFADGLLVGQLGSSASHGRSGMSGARNQIRGHDGHGNRTGLGRVTGAGKGRVRKDQQGDLHPIAAGKRAAQRIGKGPLGRAGAAAGRGIGRAGAATARQARARGARRAADTASGTRPGNGRTTRRTPTPPSSTSTSGRRRGSSPGDEDKP